jgi:hypothetical protein
MIEASCASFPPWFVLDDTRDSTRSGVDSDRDPDLFRDGADHEDKFGKIVGGFIERTLVKPMVPTPTMGPVTGLPGDRVELLDVPLMQFMDCYFQFGHGVKDLMGGQRLTGTE